jgi:anti-sigma B factor antagonist
MANLIVIERRNDLIIILDLEGRIRLGEESADFHEVLRLLVERGEKKILLNLANVSHIDSSGLGELVNGYTSLHKTGGELKLLNLSGRVYELMTVTKLLTVFDIYDDESEAIKSFTAKSAKSVYADSLM